VSRRGTDPLLRLVESFFTDYLRRLRNASRHTVISYRDTLRLFFSFVADDKRCSVADLGIEDLTADRTMRFLDHLEQVRHNSVATRNARLTALRSFFRHLVRHDPTHAGQFGRVLSVPPKRPAAPAITTYLEPEEVRVLLAQPDRRRPWGLRDYALLLFLYNTGARISEALTMRQSQLALDRPQSVRLHGKGRRDRNCPLWPQTAAALKRLLQSQEGSPDSVVFLNRLHRPLTRDGAAYIIEKYVAQAVDSTASIGRKKITPHVLRHSCAVGLLQAGNDVTVIRDYLGHQSVETTGRYTKSNLQMKRRALEAFWRRSGLTTGRNVRWQPMPDLLAFLTSL
jgi:site-specific recombinase XerD